MTRSERIRLAEKAGFSGVDARSVHIERLVALVEAAEREECAMVCQKYGDYIGKNDKSGYADLACISCATGIRARGRK